MFDRHISAMKSSNWHPGDLRGDLAEMVARNQGLDKQSVAGARHEEKEISQHAEKVSKDVQEMV